MHGIGKICDFRPKSPFITVTERDRPIVTMDKKLSYRCGKLRDALHNMQWRGWPHRTYNYPSQVCYHQGFF